MAGRRKNNKGEGVPLPQSPPRSGLRSSHKSPQPAITSPSMVQASITADEASQEHSYMPKMPRHSMEAPEMMNILVDISSRLQATELSMQEVCKEKEATEDRRSLSPR